MLNSIIKLSLRYRLLTLVLALGLVIYGTYELFRLKVMGAVGREVQHTPRHCP